jgi:hypothetical protein
MSTQHMTGEAHGPRQLRSRVAGAAADIETCRRAGAAAADRRVNVADRALDTLVGEPALAARAVPVGRLLGRKLGGRLHALLPPCAITSSRGM